MMSVEPCAENPMTTIEGLSYIASMRRSAEIGSLSTLREMISELNSRGVLTDQFKSLVSFCERASQFERVHGPDCLLNLRHRTLKTLIENGVLSIEELAAISARHKMVAQDMEAAKTAQALQSEGRRA